MTTRFKRPMLVLGATLLVMQAVFMPVGMVYAETMTDTDEQEQVELPPMKNYLEKELVSDPRFFFTQSRMQGTVEEPLQVTFFSDQEVSEARVFLPKEATLLKDQLSTGISAEEGAQPNEWIVQSKRAQNTFVLPLVVEKAGNYELSVEETTAQLEISEQKDNIEEVKSIEDSAKDSIMRNTWNIDTFPLLVNRGSHLLRPELIPDNYYQLLGSKSSVPSGFGWIRASTGLGITGGTILRNESYILPDIVQPANGNNLDLFFDVSESLNMISLSFAGGLGTTDRSTQQALKANLNLKNANNELVEAPILHNIRNSGINYITHIKKDDLIGMILSPGITSLRVIETDEEYSIIDYAPRGSGNTIGLIVRNGSQHRMTGSSLSAGAGYDPFWGPSSGDIIKNLEFESFPIEGGKAESTKTTILQGESIAINAIPNTGYRFVRWEIISGIGGIIEDAESERTNFTMGSTNAILRAVFEEIKYEVVLETNPINGGTPEVESFQLSPGEKTVIRANPNQAYDFIRWEIISGEGSAIDDPFNAVTTVTMGNEDTTIRAVYETKVVSPVDPLNPEFEADPENRPNLPEDQGLFSIDFVSTFNFGSQAISSHDQTYYAQPQRLLNEDGTVNEDEERPNYVQVSDRRSENERNGWQLAVTQKEQFETETKTELAGAQLQLMNQQLVTVQGGKEPALQATNPLNLIPGNKRTLVRAEGNEGTGTWIYRFGDADTAGQSVALHVPKGATPEAQRYSTTLLWELSAVPGN